MDGFDTSPIDPRLMPKPVLPVANGAPAQPDTPAVLPRVPMQTSQPQQTQGLAFPQVGIQGRSPVQEKLASTQEQGSGISRIHNPVLKTLATVGDVLAGTFAPRAEQLIPGTEGNYALHLARAGNAVKGEQEQQAGNIENELKRAQAHHAEAEAEALPKEQAGRTITTAEGIMQWNPDTKRYDIPAGTAPGKEEEAGKTITTDQGIMQWNPETKRYDIKAGGSPDKAAAGTVHQLEDGSLIIAHPDGSATPITMNGQPVKGKATEKTGDDFSQFYQKWLKEKGLPDSATNEKKARAEWAASNQTPERPPQALMLVPGANGQFSAQVVKPGSTVAAGALTPSGMSTENETPAQVRSRQAQAEVIKTAGDQLITAIEQNRGKLGNIGSYWNKYTNGSPIADPATAALMAQLSSFAALQPALHGFRGAQALAEFEKVIGGVPKNPDALEAAIKAIQGTAGIVANNRREQTGGGAVHYREGTTDYDIPPDKVAAFEKAHPNAKKQ